MRQSRHPLGLLLIFFVLLLNLLAASPALHECLHADASHAGHHCAVTLFAHGQMDTATTAVSVIGTLSFIATVPAAGISHFSSAIEHLPAGRAPPASAANS